MTKFVRVINTERCMGCRACVAACHVENHYEAGAPWNVMLEREVGEYPNTRQSFTTMGCMHCAQAPCEKVCHEVEAHAISTNDYGIVLIDYEKCIGCGYCEAVCPYDVPMMNQETRQLYPAEKVPYEEIPADALHESHQKKPNVAQKCTMCWHKLEKAIVDDQQHLIGSDVRYTPSCDIVCPVNARIFGDIEDPDSEVAKVIGEKQASQLKKEFGTQPSVYYVMRGGDF